jgi:Fibronectin type III domain
MTLPKTLFMAALLSCLASDAQACAVDGVASKTDTTITISWSLSGCKKLSAGDTFEVCWKEKGELDFPCGANRKTAGGESGSITIDGLSPGQTYKVRTKWHHRSTGWHLVTNRTVTMDRTSASSSDKLLLRYEKKLGGCVDFYFKYAQPINPTSPIVLTDLTLHLHKKDLVSLGFWASGKSIPLKDAKSASADEYTVNSCDNNTYFGENVLHRAQVFEKSTAISNVIVWK